MGPQFEEESSILLISTEVLKVKVDDPVIKSGPFREKMLKGRFMMLPREPYLVLCKTITRMINRNMLLMGKKQNYKQGAVVKIELSNNRVAYGRLLPIYKIGVYDFISEKNNNDLSIAEIVNHKIIMYLGIYKQVVTRKEVEVIGYIPLSAEEVAEIPGVFIQDKADFRKCTIYSPESKTGRNATPEECIGLEPFSIHPIKSLTARIEDYFAGRKNIEEELYKVILSENDPRFLTAPHLLRWNFEKEIFERKNE